jgi:hypothetical protein
LAIVLLAVNEAIDGPTAVALGSGVNVSSGVNVEVGCGSGVRVGTRVKVGVNVGMGVSVGLGVGVKVLVGIGVSDGSGVSDGVKLGVTEGTRVGSDASSSAERVRFASDPQAAATSGRIIRNRNQNLFENIMITPIELV